MTIHLSDNIRSFRRARGMTQEAIAEALGVSAAVISKWETAASEPELIRVAELADLFDTSVDILLGYRIQDKRRAGLLDRLRDLIHDKNAEVDFADLERVTGHFPHDFDVVYRLARLYALRGTESHDLRQNMRAIELFEKACMLIEQNENEEISLTSIRVDMARVYRTLGKKDKAIELLRRNNPCGVNNAVIGDIYASTDRANEAIPYLSRAMLDALSAQLSIAMGFCNAYEKQGKYSAILDVIAWIEAVVEATTLPGRLGYLQKILVPFSVLRSYACLLLARPDEARAAMREAYAHACRFDAAPNYAADSIRFVSIDYATAYDDFGDTAVDGIEAVVAEQNSPVLAALWEEISREKD